MTNRYKFPLKHEVEYPGYIKFSAFKEDFSSFVTRLYSSAVQGAIEADRRTTSETGDANLAENISAVRRLFGNTTDQQTQKTNEIEKIQGDSVLLYLPTTIAFADGVQYSEVSLGPVGTSALKALGEGQGLSGVVAAGFEGVLGVGSIQDLVREGLGSQAGQLGLLRLIKRLGSEEIRGAIESQTGITINPNARSLLRGVTMRRHRFTFKLIPSSPEESREIANIIQFFRREMYPDDIPVADIAVGMEFPSKFDISIEYEGKKVATGILPCFLETFDTTYNPTTMGMHRNPDGSFSFPEIDITMSFIEHRTLRRKDIVEGGY